MRSIPIVNMFLDAITLMSQTTPKAIIVDMAMAYKCRCLMSKAFTTILSMAPINDEVKMIFVFLAAWNPALQNNANV